jgi:hypothetical protein
LKGGVGFHIFDDWAFFAFGLTIVFAVSVLRNDELMTFTRLHDDTKARDMGQTDLALLCF